MSLSNERLAANTGRLGRLAHFVARHRWPVIGIWVVLTLFGAVAAAQLEGVLFSVCAGLVGDSVSEVDFEGE